MKNNDNLSIQQIERLDSFKKDFAVLLKKHNVLFDIEVNYVSESFSVDFHFMTSSPDKYDGELYSDIYLDGADLEKYIKGILPDETKNDA